MYIRKSTLLIGGVVIAGFVAGNIYLIIKETHEGKKVTFRSVVELAKEVKKAYSAF